MGAREGRRTSLRGEALPDLRLPSKRCSPARARGAEIQVGGEKGGSTRGGPTHSPSDLEEPSRRRRRRAPAHPRLLKKSACGLWPLCPKQLRKKLPFHKQPFYPPFCFLVFFSSSLFSSSFSSPLPLFFFFLLDMAWPTRVEFLYSSRRLRPPSCTGKTNNWRFTRGCPRHRRRRPSSCSPAAEGRNRRPASEKIQVK